MTPAEALDLLRSQLALLRESGAVEATFDGEGRLQRVALAPAPAAASGGRDRDLSSPSPVPRPPGAHVAVTPRPA
ncbi:MAG: hypothetical protein MUF64_32310 [Polyangiaceae bacterium]|nr:hypothetical protein [Polyangiaceae bacterium]